MASLRIKLPSPAEDNLLCLDTNHPFPENMRAVRHIDHIEDAMANEKVGVVSCPVSKAAGLMDITPEMRDLSLALAGLGLEMQNSGRHLWLSYMYALSNRDAFPPIQATMAEYAALIDTLQALFIKISGNSEIKGFIKGNQQIRNTRFGHIDTVNVVMTWSLEESTWAVDSACYHHQKARGFLEKRKVWTYKSKHLRWLCDLSSRDIWHAPPGYLTFVKGAKHLQGHAPAIHSVPDVQGTPRTSHVWYN